MVITQTAPPALGQAVAKILDTINAMTDAQVDTLRIQHDLTDLDAYTAAVERLDASLDMIDADTLASDHSSRCGFDPAYAVLARDRGLITDADFDTITGPWFAAGLPLPTQVTGDDETGSVADISNMTSDLIADELLWAASGTDEHGPVLALTGYNHGQLLAHPFIRNHVARSARDQSLFVDWSGLSLALDEGRDDGVLDDKEQEVLCFAIALRDHTDLTAGIGDENAEAMLFAAGYTLGVDPAKVHDTESTHRREG